MDIGRLTRRQALIGGGALVATGAIAAPDPLDALVRAQMAAASIPGLALGVTRAGRAVATRTYGFADLVRRRPVSADSMFHIASVTKTVTALAMLRLVDQRRIALDAPIASHLDFTIQGEGAGDITLRHLLMHTSGISDALYYEIDFRTRGRDAAMPLGELLKAYLAEGGRYAGAGNLKARPGAAWDYSNIGFALLGYVGSRLAGRDLREVTREEVFAPLGLRHTAWSIAETPLDRRVSPYEKGEQGMVPVDPVGFPDWPAGMLRASIGDLTRLVAVAANGGVVEGRRYASASSVAAMLDMQRPAGLPDWLTGQGLGWQQSVLDGVPRANHWGGDPGVFTMAYVDPARRCGVVLLSNLSATAESRAAMKAIAARALKHTIG